MGKRDRRPCVSGRMAFANIYSFFMAQAFFPARGKND
jgi:hypothetical protein